MAGRRYTIVIADRSSGVLRHVTINRRWAAVTVASVLAIPVLMGLGAKWSARAEIDQLQATNAVLQVENGSYRVATGDLGDGRETVVITNLINEGFTLFQRPPGGAFIDSTVQTGLLHSSLPYTGFGVGLFDMENRGLGRLRNYCDNRIEGIVRSNGISNDRPDSRLHGS